MLTMWRRYLGREIVHIRAGQEQQDYGIHKSLICNSSLYFKAAFNSGFEESKTGVMRLGEVDPGVFDLFYTYLYTNVLWSNEDNASAIREKYALGLYAFADMIQMPLLKNATIRLIYEEIMLNKNDDTGLVKMKPSTLAYVWENTVESSPLRRLMIDMCVWNVDGKATFAKGLEHGMKMPICLDIMRAMSEKLQSKDPLTNPLFNLRHYDEPQPETITEESMDSFRTTTASS